MKYKKYILSILIVLTSFYSFSEKTDGPGDPGNDPQVGGDPPLGGGAPIGSGIAILIGLGAAYGGYKIHKKKDDESKDTELP